MTFTYLCFFLTLHVFTVKSAADWCYAIQKLSNSGCSGPREWAAKCATGTFQSPINIVTKKTKFDSNLKSFHFTGYETKNTLALHNNGHSAVLSLEGRGIKISGGGLSGTYDAMQLHFHWGSKYTFGSEHSIDGERYPIELHVVHQKPSGRSESSGSSTAVLGFFIQESEVTENTKYSGIIKALSKIQANNVSVNVNVTDVILGELIPNVKDLQEFYRYNGSLTTPDCAEGVIWTVFPQTIKLGKQQIEAFYSSLNFSATDVMVENFRPQQILGERTVFHSGVEAVLFHSTYLLLSLILAYALSES